MVLSLKNCITIKSSSVLSMTTRQIRTPTKVKLQVAVFGMIELVCSSVISCSVVLESKLNVLFCSDYLL